MIERGAGRAKRESGERAKVASSDSVVTSFNFFDTKLVSASAGHYFGTTVSGCLSLNSEVSSQRSQIRSFSL